ncbi:MAG: hypothetical protein FWF95_04785 [Syntrophorhabdaceae bacterium]|nr:hypothetical protein [Syntrophorhabdaceae bacterium]
MKRPWILLLAIVICAGLVSGCASTDSISGARKQLEKAKAAGANWTAPYECFAAEAYLKKAVHEAEEGSPKQDVDFFLSKSLENSKKALESVGGAK